MSLATEAELVGLYIMAREAVYIRIILKELGHKQPPRYYKPTMQWQMPSSMAKYNQNELRQWACGSTGYKIVNANSNFEFSGDRAN